MDNLAAKLRNILQVGFDMTDFNTLLMVLKGLSGSLLLLGQ
jgi:hypothetical protein